MSKPHIGDTKPTLLSYCWKADPATEDTNTSIYIRMAAALMVTFKQLQLKQTIFDDLDAKMAPPIDNVTDLEAVMTELLKQLEIVQQQNLCFLTALPIARFCNAASNTNATSVPESTTPACVSRRVTQTLQATMLTRATCTAVSLVPTILQLLP